MCCEALPRLHLVRCILENAGVYFPVVAWEYPSLELTARTAQHLAFAVYAPLKRNEASKPVPYVRCSSRQA